MSSNYSKEVKSDKENIHDLVSDYTSSERWYHRLY